MNRTAYRWNRRGWPRPAGAVLVGLLAVATLGSCSADDPGRPTASEPAREGVPDRAPKAAETASSLAEDAELKMRAARITSTFENATLLIQYDYVENIGDGRGLTVGRAGFTSGTGDLLLFVRRYTELRPDNALASFLPALEAVNGTGSEEGLGGFAEAWHRESRRAEQRGLQDRLVDELYFEPAMKYSRKAGLRTPLGQAIMWDTMIQHGAGGEHGTKALVAETRASVPDAAGDEGAWLRAFLDVRLRHLVRAYEGTPTEADGASQSRVDALRSLVAAGKWSLQEPLAWEVYGEEFRLGG